MFNSPDHINGAFSDFSVGDRVAMWGNGDDVADMSSVELANQGFTSGEPLPPPVAGYKENRPLLRVIGSEVIVKLEIEGQVGAGVEIDDYYSSKLKNGFFRDNN